MTATIGKVDEWRFQVRRCVFRASEMQGYAPANHHGTTNAAGALVARRAAPPCLLSGASPASPAAAAR